MQTNKNFVGRKDFPDLDRTDLKVSADVKTGDWVAVSHHRKDNWA
jgi:hypothetical protein